MACGNNPDACNTLHSVSSQSGEVQGRTSRGGRTHVASRILVVPHSLRFLLRPWSHRAAPRAADLHPYHTRITTLHCSAHAQNISMPDRGALCHACAVFTIRQASYEHKLWIHLLPREQHQEALSLSQTAVSGVGMTRNKWYMVHNIRHMRCVVWCMMSRMTSLKQVGRRTSGPLADCGEAPMGEPLPGICLKAAPGCAASRPCATALSHGSSRGRCVYVVCVLVCHEKHLTFENSDNVHQSMHMRA
jgi:hypothetical protein